MRKNIATNRRTTTIEMVLDWHYYVAFLTGYLTHPRTPMAMGTSAAATSATDGFAARVFDGGCAGASGLFHWYRVSSCLLNHDPDVTQARCSPEVQRNAYSKPCTHDDYTHLVPSFHSLRSPVLSLHSGVSVL